MRVSDITLKLVLRNCWELGGLLSSQIGLAPSVMKEDEYDLLSRIDPRTGISYSDVRKLNRIPLPVNKIQDLLLELTRIAKLRIAAVEEVKEA